ncbi:MAG: hypothetical protein ABIK65_11245 [Candidatus Eisenbacteria bacterium]
MRVEHGAPHVNPARENGAGGDRRTGKAADGSRRFAGDEDRVQISLEARDLQAGRAPKTGPSGQAPDARMERIMNRLDSGYYDSSEAIEALVDELMLAFGF